MKLPKLNPLSRYSEVMHAIGLSIYIILSALVGFTVFHMAYRDAVLTAVAAGVIGNFIIYLPPGLQQGTVKTKAKRTADRLSLYRDWPPDLVDAFLDWENLPITNRYGYVSPPGYVHWKRGMAYLDHVACPEEFVHYIWR